MAEDNRDPFDFEEDPLDGVEDLDLPPAFEPPEATIRPPVMPPPSVSTPPEFGEPPKSVAPPTGAPPTGFPPPSDPTQASPPVAPPDYGNFAAPTTGTPGIPTGGSGIEPPEQPLGMPPSYGGAPAPGSYGASMPPPQSYGASMPPPAYGTGVPPQAPPQKKNRGCLFWGVIVLVISFLLIGGCTAFVVFSGQSASDAANEFLAEVDDGDFDGAASLTNPTCNLTAARIETDLAGLSQYFIIGVGPIASGSVTIDGQEFTILFDLRDDQICSYTLDNVTN